MTLWHKFLVCFTWAAPGYIWGTTFFAFHGLFHRHCHCPCHQWLCPQHHWWPGVFSVPDVAGTFAWGSQSGRCSCHMQGDLAWGPPDWCLVPWACMCHCIQEARAMYTTSSGTPRCSGAAGSAASAPRLHFLHMKNPLTFRHTTVCISGVPMCWIEKKKTLFMNDVIYKM